LTLLYPQTAGAAGGDGGQALLSGIGISIIAATVLAYLGNLTKQPLLLAYIAAGAAIGPHFGLGLVQSQAEIRILAEIGLILLLFMIGLELDLRKLKASGKALIMTGVFQFLLCAAMGLGFFCTGRGPTMCCCPTPWRPLNCSPRWNICCGKKAPASGKRKWRDWGG
jgi:hypothetical protein